MKISTEINLSLLKHGRLTSLKNIAIRKACPLVAYDIELNHLKRTHYGLNVSLDLSQFMQQHRLKWANLYLGLTAVLKQKMVCSTMQCSIVENMLIFTINVIGCMNFKNKKREINSRFLLTLMLNL